MLAISHWSEVWALIVVFIKDWPEVWALFIPIYIQLIKRRQPAVNRSVIIYVWVALLLNVAIDMIWKFKLLMRNNHQYNGFLYNFHSIVRFLLFDAYFSKLRMSYTFKIKKVMLFVFVAFMIVNFGFFEKFFDPDTPFSSLLLSVEAALLLVLCLHYYFFKLNKEEENRDRQPDFWIVTGLSMYVTINFFIFLLYKKLSQQSVDFGVNLWKVHNVSYVIMNLFFAKAFYESGR